MADTKRTLDPDDLANVVGGTGACAYYCVQGYSKSYGGNVKLYVFTYQDAVKLCEKLGMSIDCIKEVNGVH